MGGQSNNTIIKKKKRFFLWATRNAKEMLGFLFWFFALGDILVEH
jgi:hypothetical protein